MQSCWVSHANSLAVNEIVIRLIGRRIKESPNWKIACSEMEIEHVPSQFLDDCNGRHNDYFFLPERDLIIDSFYFTFNFLTPIFWPIMKYMVID